MGNLLNLFNPLGKKRWRMDQENRRFRDSLNRKELTIAQFTHATQEDVSSWKGFSWDPFLEAEMTSARKMLTELDEAIKIGGKAGRDEWVAHYKARLDAKKPIPRQWYDVIRSFPQTLHPVLAVESEVPRLYIFPTSWYPQHYSTQDTTLEVHH